MANSTIKILIAEDHEISRAGLRSIFEQRKEFTIVGESENGIETVNKVISLSPDVVLMDIGLPGLDGIESTRRIKSTHPNIRIVMLTANDDKGKVLASLAAGADAYCLKNISVAQLFNAITTVVDGAVWLDSGIAKYVLETCVESSQLQTEPNQHHNETKGHQFTISLREQAVLDLLVEGLTNRQIADRLSLSPETVKTHLKHIMGKLMVSDRTQAALKAMRQKLV